MYEEINFEWDEANITHLARHDITPQEAEEAIRSKLVPLQNQLRGGEYRAMFLGETLSGKILQVVTTRRHAKIRIVTAWPASRIMRERWQKERAPR